MYWCLTLGTGARSFNVSIRNMSYLFIDCGLVHKWPWYFGSTLPWPGALPNRNRKLVSVNVEVKFWKTYSVNTVCCNKVHCHMSLLVLCVWEEITWSHYIIYGLPCVLSSCVLLAVIVWKGSISLQQLQPTRFQWQSYLKVMPYTTEVFLR